MAWLWLIDALFLSTLCCAQVTGTFSLEKATFAPGEPVDLFFTLKNAGKDPVEVANADPYSFCSGYKVHVNRDGHPEPTCSQSWGGSCMSGALSLAPGASRIERLLLNYRNDPGGDPTSPVRLAGDYTVEATRVIEYAPARSESRLYSAPDRREVDQVLHFRVEDSVELSANVYAPYVEQLQSKEEGIRREAARTLATMAPPTLEPLLLSFASSRDYVLNQFAPLALANLSTKASLAALAELLLHAEPGSYEYIMAAQYLGGTHDPAWFPLLLEVADQHGAMYLAYAAESAGDAAVPALLTRLQTSDAGARNAVIYALGRTGSRAAVPLLVRFLDTGVKAQDRDATRLANAALTQLTHVYAEQGDEGSLIPSWHTRWQRWWMAEGSTARIYRPEECVAETQLP